MRKNRYSDRYFKQIKKTLYNIGGSLYFNKPEVENIINKIYQDGLNYKSDEQFVNCRDNLKYAMEIINKLMDIAEDYYPKYTGSDFICEVNDFIKKINKD